MNELMKRSSSYLIISGALAVVFGLVAAFFPIATALTLIVVWGIYALIDGIAAAVMAFRPGPGQSRGFLIFAAVVGIAAGLIAVSSPATAGGALVWVLGVWLMVRGVLEIVAAFTERAAGDRWLLVLGGVFWLIAGWLIVANPGVAALSVALWLGVLAIIWGNVLLIVGFHVRGIAKENAPIPGEVSDASPSVPPPSVPPAGPTA